MTLAKLISCNEKLKQPKQFEGNIFTVYSPKKLMLTLPEESKAFLTTKFTGQHIQNITRPVKQRLWITLLNKSYFEKYTIDKGDVVGYLVFEPDNLKVQREAKEKQPRQSSSSCTTGSRSGKNTRKKQRRRQTGGFLNRYDFAYAGRDTVNQLGKIAPDIINQATGEINKIAQQRIDQVVRSGAGEIE